MDLIKLLFIQFTFTIAILGSLLTFLEPYLPGEKVFNWSSAHSINLIFRFYQAVIQIWKTRSQRKVWKAGGTNGNSKVVVQTFLHIFFHLELFVLLSGCWRLLSRRKAIIVSFRIFKFFLRKWQTNWEWVCTLDLSNFIVTSFHLLDSPITTLTALFLMVLQCTRRFVETNFLQIFSKKSKINLSHYLVGYLHYYGVMVLILAKAAGFIESGGKNFFFRVSSWILINFPFLRRFLSICTNQRLDSVDRLFNCIHFHLVQAIRIEFDFHKSAERQRRCCRNWKAFVASRRLVQICIFAPYAFRNFNVLSFIRSAECKHHLHLLFLLGFNKSNFNGLVHSKMVSGEFPKVSQGEEGHHSIFDLRN